MKVAKETLAELRKEGAASGPSSRNQGEIHPWGLPQASNSTFTFILLFYIFD